MVGNAMGPLGLGGVTVAVDEDGVEGRAKPGVEIVEEGLERGVVDGKTNPAGTFAVLVGVPHKCVAVHEAAKESNVPGLACGFAKHYDGRFLDQMVSCIVGCGVDAGSPFVLCLW